MMRVTVRPLSAIALVLGAACVGQSSLADSRPALAAAHDSGKVPETAAAATAVQPAREEVIVSTAGLYGDWRMVLPEWPGSATPVTGDYCRFKKRGNGVSIICADDFLQEVPEVALDDNKLRMRWGGAFKHTIYDAVWEGNGTFDGELTQASMGLITHRFRAKMERVLDAPAKDAPKDSVTVLKTYFDDLASRSIHENFYENDVYRSMKKTANESAWPRAGFATKYFGRILEDKGRGATFPDVFKVSSAEGNERWCLVRIDAAGLADVRCREIP